MKNGGKGDMTPDDGWAQLRRLTPARIGLPRSGASLATRPLLEFRLAHARARDAVWERLDEARLAAELADCGIPVVSLASAAPDRQAYLLRPDLGRQMAAESEATLKAYRGDYDVVFVIADGLSSRAVQLHARSVLGKTLSPLRAEGWKIAPLTVVRHGRVAIGDAIAAVLGAACATVLIGERPGLSAPDSMGAYLTYRPHPHTSDAERNCISNIRPEGVDYDSASRKIVYLLRAMRAAGRSGVTLKDDSDRLSIGTQAWMLRPPK